MKERMRIYEVELKNRLSKERFTTVGAHGMKSAYGDLRFFVGRREVATFARGDWVLAREVEDDHTSQ